MAEAVRSRRWSGNGPWGQRCRQSLEHLVGGGHAFLTPSCTAALEMAALVLAVGPGDEVVVPAYTFVSSASAFALFGARIRFCDVQPNTVNLDPDALEAVLTPRTRAVVAVHYAGVGCEMVRLRELADHHGFHLVEDNAHGIFGRYQGRPLGSFGDLSAFSFHETKNLSCGEGGALVLNRPDWLERAQIAQEKGTDRSRFLLGLTDKYTWIAPGSSYLLGELPAALLSANFQAAEAMQRHRCALWQRYQEELSDWCDLNGVQQPFVPPDCEHPGHLYYLLMPDLEQRQSLMNWLRERGIQAAYHYQALSASPMALEHGSGPGDCPVAESIAGRLLRLPLFADLSITEQDRVMETVIAWRRS